MKCPNCKVNIPNNATKCPVCGGAISTSPQNYKHTGKSHTQYNKHTGKSHTQYNKPNRQYSKYTKKKKSNGLTVDPSEYVIDSLDNSYAVSAMTGGGLAKTSVFYTNKRVYANYKDYTMKGKGQVNAIVDLKEISGTLLCQNNPIYLLVIAVLAVLVGLAANMFVNGAVIGGIVVGAILGVRWFLERTLVLEISFQGDRIGIMLKGYSYDTADKFHKSLRAYLAQIKNV